MNLVKWNESETCTWSVYDLHMGFTRPLLFHAELHTFLCCPQPLVDINYHP